MTDQAYNTPRDRRSKPPHKQKQPQTQEPQRPKEKEEEEEVKEEKRQRGRTFEVQRDAPKGPYHYPQFPTPWLLADAQTKTAAETKRAKEDNDREKEKKKAKKGKKGAEEEDDNRVPPPCPTVSPKRQFFRANEYEEVDARSAEAPPHMARAPLRVLVDYLGSGLDDKGKVRAFYVWIGAQDLLSFEWEEDVPDGSALYLLLLVHSGVCTLNDLLAHMCSTAGIPVEMITGSVKCPEHRIGSKPISGYKWIGVCINGSWRLVDQDAATGYVIKSTEYRNIDFTENLPDHITNTESLYLSPRKKPAEQILSLRTPRSNGSPKPNGYVAPTQTPRPAGIASLKDVVLTQQRNDFFFFPDPEQFIYDHCAEDPKWQLLARWVTKEEFVEMASLDEDFFEFGLIDTSEPRGFVKAEKGHWQLKLTSHPKSHFRLNHHLTKLKGAKKQRNNDDLNGFVYTENLADGKLLRACFTDVGFYLLSLFATDTHGTEDQEPVRVARYLIECDTPVFGAEPNPINPRGEFGPGVEMIEADLEPLTHTTGSVQAQLGMAVIRLRCNGRPYEFTHFLESREFKKAQLSALSRHYHIGKEVIFVMKLPKSGKYLFRIYAHPYGESGTYTNICNYLINSDIGCLDDTPFPPASHGQVGMVAKNPEVVLFPVSHQVPIVRDIEAGALHLSLASNCDLELSPQLDLQGEDFREDLSEYVWHYSVPEDKKIEVFLRFPRAGMYSLNLYGRPVLSYSYDSVDVGTTKAAYQDLLKYILVVDQPHTQCFAVPGTHVAWQSHYQIRSPQDGYLLPKTKYNFEVQIPEAEEVGILSHSWSTIPLTKRISSNQGNQGTHSSPARGQQGVVPPSQVSNKRDEDWWDGEVDSGPGGRNITLVARFPEQSTYTYLLEFQVLEAKEITKIRQEQEEADREARSRLKRLNQERQDEQAEVDYQQKRKAALVKKQQKEHEDQLEEVQDELRTYRKYRNEAWEAEAEAERSRLEQSQRPPSSKREEEARVQESIRKMRMALDSGYSYYRKKYQGLDVHDSTCMRTKMAREQMREATRLRDRQMLQTSIAAFEQQRLTEQEKDLTNAKRTLNSIIAKEMLIDAKDDMDADALQRALDYVKTHSLHGQLQREVQEAERLLNQLQKADQLKYSILNMDRTTISEMKSYQRPPDMVRKVMTASLLILGEDEHTTREWSTVQRQCGCMGHEGLNRRILDLEVEDLHPEIVARAKQITQPLKHSVVRTVSAGSAAFHVWLMGTIDAYEKIHKDNHEYRRAKPADINRQRELFGRPALYAADPKNELSF
ncbi:hypothetical protein CAPTEDRAFT_217920 [Capitella teleta]|uniref:KY-like immunoglobulin-like domain-containing protein n=1 Tax=Capitella teleta TaxID=283909 RepID=R7VC83_CAPTE|nr:hypothetical protein CAPTEDRAFT_217920 [Capitella teleta]|eukprot:ELU13290.1 hypothetical protein CAPTEDRAFT_217920 [Capitella teleta]